MGLSIRLAGDCPYINLSFLKSEVQAPTPTAPYLKLYNRGKTNGFLLLSLGDFSQEKSHLSQCLKSQREANITAFWACQCSIYFSSAGTKQRWRILPQSLWFYIYFCVQCGSLVLLLCQSNLPHYKSAGEVIYWVYEWNSELSCRCLCGLECSFQRINVFSWQLPQVFFACKAREWGR